MANQSLWKRFSIWMSSLRIASSNRYNLIQIHWFESIVSLVFWIDKFLSVLKNYHTWLFRTSWKKFQTYPFEHNHTYPSIHPYFLIELTPVRRHSNEFTSMWFNVISLWISWRIFKKHCIYWGNKYVDWNRLKIYFKFMEKYFGECFRKIFRIQHETKLTK